MGERRSTLYGVRELVNCLGLYTLCRQFFFTISGYFVINKVSAAAK